MLTWEPRGEGRVDWQLWHTGYDDPNSPLSQRLEVVRSELRRCLDRLPEGHCQVVSLCAGDGRDLLGALCDHPRRGDVRGLLVELDPGLAERARRSYVSAGLEHIEIRVADAGDPANYTGLKADLLIVCGVLGNITDEGVLDLVRRLPGLSAPSSTLVWTRHSRPPDLTPAIRTLLGEIGYSEIAFHVLEGSWGAVGSARYDGPVISLPEPSRPLFTFTPDRTQSWQQRER